MLVTKTFSYNVQLVNILLIYQDNDTYIHITNINYLVIHEVFGAVN